MGRPTNLIARTNPRLLVPSLADKTVALWVADLPEPYPNTVPQLWFDKSNPQLAVLPGANNTPNTMDFSQGTRDTRGRAAYFQGGRIVWTDPAPFALGQQDFCIFTKIAFDAAAIASSRVYVLGKSSQGGSNQEWSLNKPASNLLQWQYIESPSSTLRAVVGPTVVANRAYEVYIYRINTTMGMIVDGIPYAETTTVQAPAGSVSKVAIGGLGEYTTAGGGTTGGSFGVTHQGWIYYFWMVVGASAGRLPIQPTAHQLRGLLNNRQV